MDSTVGRLIGQQPASGIAASGYNLMVGVNAQAQGHWNEVDAQFFSDSYDTLEDASAAHRACMQVAFQRIADEPENVMNLLVYKFRDLWQTDDFGIDWNLYFTQQQGTLTPELSRTMEAVRPVGRVMYMAALVFSLLYGLNLWRSKTAGHPMAMVCIIFFLGTALSHMLLETQVRYHYNMLPFLMLLATMGMTSWRKRVQEEALVQVVYQQVEASAQEHDDNTHFDMRAALVEGNIIMTVTEAYQTEAEKKLTEADAPVTEAPAEPAEPVPAEPKAQEDAAEQAEMEHAEESAELEDAGEPEDAAEPVPAMPAEPVIQEEAEIPAEPALPEAACEPEAPSAPAIPEAPARQAKVLPVARASGKQAVRYTPDMIRQLRQQHKHSK